MLLFFLEVTPISTSFLSSRAVAPQKQLLLTSVLLWVTEGAESRRICLAEVLAIFIF